MEEIDTADTIKSIHLACRQAIRREGVDPSEAIAKRDAAIERLQEKYHQGGSSCGGSSNNSNMSQAQEIMPRVFLGPFSLARNGEKLNELGITHVVCLSAEGRCELGNVIYLEHPLVEVECTLDKGAEQIAEIIPSCVAFVRCALSNASESNHKILIHCLHGRTRSAAVAGCVRSVILGETFEEAYRNITSARDVFVPVEWRGRLQEAIDKEAETLA